MTETTIEWTHRPGTVGRTWNPTRGCSHALIPGTTKSDPACAHCYAERNGARQANGGVYTGLIKIGLGGSPRWTGRVDVVNDLSQPLRWQKQSTIFVNSMSDLYHETIARMDIAAIFGVMALAPWHDYLILTKRSERMREIMSTLTLDECLDAVCRHPEVGGGRRQAKLAQRAYARRDLDPQEEHWPLPWVWLGVSVGTKNTLSRLDDLRATPAAVRFVSFEPLLEDVTDASGFTLGKIDWCVIGGESGPQARVCATQWIASLIAACHTWHVAPFVKQLGAVSESHEPVFKGDGEGGYVIAGHQVTPSGLAHKKGGEITEWPRELRVREWPQ